MIERNLDTLIIVPNDVLPLDSGLHTFETPYGTIHACLRPLGAWRAAWVSAADSPFAAVYAAKAAGATRIVELAPVVARNRLLEPGDLLLPDDLIDRTQHPRYTFFAGKGYGFLAQREPFCPTLRGALLAAAPIHAPRVFARGVYLAAEEPNTIGPDAGWDADIVGSGVVPISFLARELELCYAPLCVVDGRVAYEKFASLLADALRSLPEMRACGCSTAMQQYRDRGDIGADWRTWIGTTMVNYG
jgi:5'-methylthioadenosine phosphorylase